MKQSIIKSKNGRVYKYYRATFTMKPAIAIKIEQLSKKLNMNKSNIINMLINASIGKFQ